MHAYRDSFSDIFGKMKDEKKKKRAKKNRGNSLKNSENIPIVTFLFK